MNTLAPTIMSWPLGGVDEQGRLGYAREEESVREVMLNILLTRPGERLMRPGFGAGLLDFVHRPNNETTRHLLADVISKAIRRWEPRVVLDRVEVRSDPERLAEVNVQIRYHLRHGGSVREVGLSLALGQ